MAAMRHPNIVNFLGICSLPPCILTGGRLKLHHCAFFAVQLCFGCKPALLMLCTQSCCLLQSFAARAPSMTCCAGRAVRHTWRPS